MDTFGSRLRSLRERRGWSQEKLGFELEVSSATVSKWETNRGEPNLRHLEGFLRIFAKDGMTLDWLIAGKGAGNSVTKKPRTSAENLARTAETQDEQLLLLRYRELSAKKRKMLLGLIED
ncbi:helix-turn-helix transcriptional regulator [Lysobacter sp. K5869]|uniref:helix-turn-helix domain-containing protein n=1 Tax=Lysobacter sp. K5869 TaxID=2820808 RepID=UPI001C060A71|nr:helix-turn-helix transcriptional regulator [Lysobacter sp. K5869]QWP78137.1 helix-turn-helix transcriptional regulator [Lysobacter sp. K5869]